MEDKKSGKSVERKSVGELVIWRGESPRIIICDVCELKNLEARRKAGLFSGPMARVEFPGVRALAMYNPLMDAVRDGGYDYGTYYANDAECGCGFARKYLTEKGIAGVGNLLIRLTREILGN